TRAALRVRHADDSRFQNHGVTTERRFDLVGADAIASGLDDVVLSADIPEVAVIIAIGDVFGMEPGPAEVTVGLFGPAPVSKRIVGIAAREQADFSRGSRRRLAPLFVKHAHIPSGYGRSH